MKLTAQNGLLPPIGTIIKITVLSGARKGQRVPIHNPSGYKIGILRCLGPVPQDVRPMISAPPKDVARGQYNFEVIE